ncbi:alpha/beta fold hydrolase [Dapis sp. BLCC M229]|uniref:alpha/beta fold hydrolase n=1 Tax=Dapis sp. BLCC M229 TaxID=3400188 RepID=UPI003CE928FB
MKIKRAFLDTEDGQIHYRIGGEGEPLILLHQQPRSSDEYKELMSILAQKKQVIAMDFLGFGDSDKPPRMYSIEDYAKNVIQLLDTLNIKKASILGNHTGAFVAGEVASAYSERLNKLILCNFPNFGEQGKKKLLEIYSKGYQIQEDGSHLIARWLARSNYVGTPELNHRWVLDDLKCFGYPMYAVYAVANYCLNFKESLSLIQCPTLLLWGLEDVKQFENLGLAKAEDRLIATQLIPNTEVVELEEGNICMMNQMFKEISEIIIKFLDK